MAQQPRWRHNAQTAPDPDPDPDPSGAGLINATQAVAPVTTTRPIGHLLPGRSLNPASHSVPTLASLTHPAADREPHHL